jgi:acetyl-CoA carboxylase biotin carboxylase subunit
MFRKILIANRGEVALRIIRACKELGVKAAAIYSEADKESLHLKFADEIHFIGPPQPNQSYLNIEKIIQTAKKSKSEAIHPGYGFLAQIPAFASACEKNKIKFIGPSSAVLKKMGNKLVARKTMAKAGLPVIPGTMDELRDVEEAREAAEKLGYPVILKAVYGGGGRGMRVVTHKRELDKAFELARLEAETSFGKSQIYMEKQLTNPRHIEFQILADEKGNVIHLGERECSIQRKHQKLMEETPSSMMTDELRKTMGEAAVRAAKAVNYTNAGTVEFLVDKNGAFYFLEMNTRLQVEHLITEMVTGIDIVKEQIRIASGEPLHYRQEDITMNGHAINCRINAEDPEKDFSPCPGTVTAYRAPGGPGVRVDSALYVGYTIPVFYDSLIAKLAVWGRNREEAIRRLRNALEEYQVEGVETTIPLLKKIVEDEQFINGRIDTGFVKNRIEIFALEKRLSNEDIAALVASLIFSKRSKPQLAVIPKRKIVSTSRWKFFEKRSDFESYKWGL